VTVCTNHVALCHLVKDALPGSLAPALADAEFLVAQTVELEDERICLPAIDAWVLSQEGNQTLDPLDEDFLAPAARVVYVSLPMGRIMLLLVLGTGKADGSCPASPSIFAATRSPRLVSPAGIVRSASLGRGATVSMRTDVRIEMRQNGVQPRGVAQSGSALGWGPSGRRFKSCLPD
jgi:hypothetical protein